MEQVSHIHSGFYLCPEDFSISQLCETFRDGASAPAEMQARHVSDAPGWYPLDHLPDYDRRRRQLGKSRKTQSPCRQNPMTSSYEFWKGEAENLGKRRLGGPLGSGPTWGCSVISGDGSEQPQARVPAQPRLPPAGRAPPPWLPLGDIEGPADGGAARAGQLGLPVADEVLEERTARQQSGGRQLQEQCEQEGGGQRQPQRAQRVQHRELDPCPVSHGPGAGYARAPPALPPRRRAWL